MFYKRDIMLFWVMVIMLTIAYVQQLSGQEDSHYWTQQYGAKGLLLNGALIANADAETSIFYNPGGMGFSSDVGFAFSFFTPSYSRLDNINYIGTGNTIRDDGFRLAPGFLAVTYKPFQEKKFIIGAAAFKRYNTNVDYNDRVVGSLDSRDFFLYRADFDFERNISEDWYGLSLAYNVTEYLGIGISQFFVWRGESARFGFIKEILPGISPEEVVQSWRYNLNYDLSINGAFTTKFGFNYRNEDLKIGLTMTSPLYAIVNTSTSYSFDDQRVDVANNTVLTQSNSKTLPLNDFKAPASIGVGFDFVLNPKFTLSLSSEYFWVSEEIVHIDDTDDALDGFGRNGGAIYNFRLSTLRESVFNMAVGFQYTKSDKVKWMGGIRTDQSARSSYLINNTTEYIGTGPSIVNLSGGGRFTSDKNDFSVGLNIGYGRSDGRRQLIDLNNINSANLYEFSANNNVTSKYYSVMLFFTYDFIFSKF